MLKTASPPAVSDTTSAILILTAIAICAIYLAYRLFRDNRKLSNQNHRLTQDSQRAGERANQIERELRTQIATLKAPKPRPPRKTDAEMQEEEIERANRQLYDVSRKDVQFFTKQVMNFNEAGLFYAALDVLNQPRPQSPYPFFAFPQVCLGEVIATGPANTREARQAHRAINSKRCDLLIADTFGRPIAVFEYQGGGHNIGATAGIRAKTKRVALEGASVRVIEIEDRTTSTDMKRRIQDVLEERLAARSATRHR